MTPTTADLASLSADALAAEIYADPNGPCPHCYERVAELVRRLKTAEDALSPISNQALGVVVGRRLSGIEQEQMAIGVRNALAAIRPNPEMSVPCQEPERSGLVDGT